MTTSSSPIGFLDSGIGGITVLKKSARLLPNENLFFFSDSKNNPYGDKSDTEIIRRCTEITRFMIEEKNCKAIVIACNTASAKAARSLRATFKNVPVIAIEPAYKMVHDQSPDGRTLIMATKGTISSEKFRRLYYSYYNHKTAIHACAGLADLIEQDKKEEIIAYLEKNLGKYKNGVENVVLGCTHYPLIKNEIREVLGNEKFFDGADGVSRRLKYILESKCLLNNQDEKGTVEFFDSSADEKTREIKKERFYSILNSPQD